MKKIVGILAAAALIATSVFAADVSAKVRIDGDIFAYDGAATELKDDGKVEPAGAFSLLRASSQAKPYWSPYITLSVSTDNAGGQVLFVEDVDGERNVKIDRPNVWFKPLDMLKITAGFQEYMMNQETIDWTSISKADQDFGYAVSYAQDAISVNLFLGTGNNGWFFKDAIANCGSTVDPAASYLKDLYVNGAYEADFGKISAMFEFKGKGGDVKAGSVSDKAVGAWTDEDSNPTTPATWVVTPAGTVTKPKYTSFNSQMIKFGAGYGNTIDNLTFWADVVATSRAALSDKEFAAANAIDKKDGESEIEFAKRIGIMNKKDDPTKSKDIFGMTVDGFVQYNMDALTLKGYVKADIFDFGMWYTNKDGEKKDSIMANNNFALGLKVRADYKLDNGLNLYAYFGNDNLLRKEIKDSTKTSWDDAESVFVSTIKVGANGDVGIVSWETSLKFDTGLSVKGCTDGKKNNQYDKIKVSMPIYFQVAF